MSFIQKKMRQLGAETSVAAILICGGVNALVGVLIRLLVGSPYATVYLWRIESFIPPVWFMTLCFTIAFFAVGAVFGGVLFRRRGSDADRYRGGMLYLLLLFAEYLWYPLFFGAGQAFLSLLLIAVILFLCVMIILNWWHFCRVSSVLTILHGLWCLYLFILMLMVVLRG